MYSGPTDNPTESPTMAPNVIPANDGNNSNGIGTGYVIGWILTSIVVCALGFCVGYIYVGRCKGNDDGLLRESISMQERRNHGSTDAVVTDCSDIDY